MSAPTSPIIADWKIRTVLFKFVGMIWRELRNNDVWENLSNAVFTFWGSIKGSLMQRIRPRMRIYGDSQNIRIIINIPKEVNGK